VSVFDEFQRLLEADGGPALDVGYGVVARAVLGEGGDTVARLDDEAARVNCSDAETLMVRLFASGRLVGDTVTYDDPANGFIHCVLDRGVGIPLTLSVVAIEVGRRLGIGLLPVGMPGHFLVADADRPGWCYDPFHGGTALDAAASRALYHRTTGLDDWQDGFLRPVTSRVVFARMLTNLKSSYRRRDQLGRLRSVMALRARFDEFADREAGEFARLMRALN
jgi:regulator of sirC expression with transglutaminase-like and TPR domain